MNKLFYSFVVGQLNVLIFLFNFWGEFTAGECIHEKLSRKFQPTIIKNDNSRRSLQQSGQISRPIEIFFDDSNLKLSSNLKAILMDKMVPVASDFFKRRLTVMKRVGKNLKIVNETCNEVHTLS